jgi:beta-lactamase class A
MAGGVAVSRRIVVGALLAAFALAADDADAQRRRRRRAPRPQPKAWVPQLPAPAASLSELQALLDRIAGEPGGKVGFTVVHVESGERASLRPTERFPLASLYKVPAAIQFFHRVDEGELRVSDLVQLGPAEARTGRSLISARISKERVTYSIEELLRLALVQSDNAAADMILFLAGGPQAVTARLRALGITDMTIDRNEGEVTFNFYGVTPPPMETWTIDGFYRAMESVSAQQRREAFERFLSDTRDTSTPDAMVALFVRILKGDLLQRASADRLVDLLLQTKTGSRRIRGLLPPGTLVAHRTGTCSEHAGVSGCTNDAGAAWGWQA